MKKLLLSLVLAVLFVVCPARADKTITRTNIERAARAAAEKRPLPQGARATTALLLAIAEHEGHYRESIARCRILGDHGQAHGSYQLHPEAFGSHDAGEVCASDALQAELALSVLHLALALDPKAGIDGAVRKYANRDYRRHTPASREILALYRRHLRGMTERRRPKRTTVLAYHRRLL